MVVVEKKQYRWRHSVGISRGPNALMTFRTDVELISNQNVLIPNAALVRVLCMMCTRLCRGGRVAVNNTVL